MCLEEMGLGAVLKGAVYRHRTRARYEVAMSADLREHTLRVIAEVRTMLETGQMPPPMADERCPNCSLKDACLPEAVTDQERQALYRQELFEPQEGGQHEAEP
jgi:CRISPR-associated exonuclease Cas4